MERTLCVAVECGVLPSHDNAEDSSELSGDAFYEAFLAPMEVRLLRAVWRVVRDPERSRDALQEALTVVWRRRARIRAHPNPEALIMRICLDAALDALRKERRQKRHLELHTGALPELPTQDDTAGAAEERQLREQVQAAIARLPGKQAVAVLMRVVQEEEYSVIAAALGCSEPTARVHVMRGRTRLGRLLAHLAPHPGHSGGAA